jgi:xanthine dehydrogenase YagT iron-sulfur-binding subunit
MKGSLEDDLRPPVPDLTRRECVSVLGAASVAAGLDLAAVAGLAAPAEAASPAQTVLVAVRINNTKHDLTIDPRLTLLDLLREHLGLTGTKKGCDHGQCGACTVLLNGNRINSCLTLAACVDGDRIETIEGIEKGGALDPVQSAFVDADAFQCGYCTPGQICSAVALLSEARRGDASFVTKDLAQLGSVDLTDSEVRERMSGNICRCGAYPQIVRAVRIAEEQETSR